LKILVVDDDPDILESLSVSISLRWPDSAVLFAQTGKGGLEMAEGEPPDVIILDVGLPDMDGFEVCREIRQFSDVPIIMLTVRDQEMDKVKGLEIGADDYVTKPFSYIELLSRIQAALRRAYTATPVPLEDTRPFTSRELRVDFATRRVFVNDKEVSLTPTEYRLLYHLI